MTDMLLSEKPIAARSAVREARRPSAPPKPGRAAGSGEWVSSLAHADLACLLQVIESELLPRLLREYRPSDQGSLGSTRR